MHIILVILGSIITVLILVKQYKELKIDLSWFNFSQQRRKKAWLEKMNADPLFSIASPMESTGCLMYAMAKCSGDIPNEQKKCVRALFQSDFRPEENKAIDLLASCSFLIKGEDIVLESFVEFMKPSFAEFDAEKKMSAVKLIGKVNDCEGTVSGKQTEFMR